MACWLKILHIHTQEWYSCIIFLVFEEPHIGFHSCQVNLHFYKQCITIPSPRILSTMCIAVWLAVIILTRVRWTAMQFQSAFPWWIRIWCLFSILLFISLLSVNAVLGVSISWFSSFSVSILSSSSLPFGTHYTFWLSFHFIWTRTNQAKLMESKYIQMKKKSLNFT